MRSHIRGIGMTSQRTRDRLIDRLREKGIRNEPVLEVIRRTPRHLFVDEALSSRAYEDTALPIGFNQTISQPYIVARMTEILLATNPQKVLEIGTGSAYQAAVADAAPGAKFRIRGMRLARAPHRQSGRTAARAVVFVHEPRATQDTDTARTFSMEGYAGVGAYDRPPELLPFAWAPGWNSPQAWNKFQMEVGGALKGGDPGVHLFGPATDARPVYFTPPAATHEDPSRGDFRIAPLFEHFGIELLQRHHSVQQPRGHGGLSIYEFTGNQHFEGPLARQIARHRNAGRE